MAGASRPAIAARTLLMKNMRESPDARLTLKGAARNIFP